MINESCRSKRRCLLSSLQGPSPLVRIAEYRKRTKKFNASYSAVIKLSFGESNRRVVMPRLSRGDISCSFGELTVDLGGVEDFSEQCNLTASCSFGELELRVPRYIRVEPNTSTAFASIDFEGMPDVEPKGILHLDANVSFGEITIRYI